MTREVYGLIMWHEHGAGMAYRGRKGRTERVTPVIFFSAKTTNDFK